MPYFDAHLDLAYLAESGRDMTCPDLAACGGPHPPASVTLPSLRAGNVRVCLATIFTQALPDPSAPSGPHTYPWGDAQAAHAAGRRQLDRYHQWQSLGLVRLLPRRGSTHTSPAPPTPTDPLHVGILMECADPIRSPDELVWWADRGVVAVGLAWVHQGRYAAGNAVIDPHAGLTDLGRALVQAMDDLNLVHDLSHLSQRATDDLLALTSGPVIASHSNARALFPDGASHALRQRHLADDTIREIARRGGVIGLNLFSDFLDPNLPPGGAADVTWGVRHADHIASIGGPHVLGLGSDMDGGFPASRLPQGIQTPYEITGLCRGLETHGWSEAKVADWAWNNHARFWGLPLDHQ